MSIDPAILGNWTCLPIDDTAGGASAALEVRAGHDRTYEVSFAIDDPPDHFTAYASQVGDQVVLNVKDLKPLINRPWSFVKYSLLRPNVLYVELLSDTLLKRVEDSPSALRAALQKLKGDPELFVDYCVCVRAKAPDPKTP